VDNKVVSQSAEDMSGLLTQRIFFIYF